MFNLSIKKFCQSLDFYWHINSISISQWDVESTESKPLRLPRQQRWN